MKPEAAAALTIGLFLAGGSALAWTPKGSSSVEPAVEPAVERGAQLAQERCASCHAVALEARSPEHDAPQFRVLSRVYSRQDLVRKLDDIAANGHFEMPPVALREDEMQDIAAYISTLDGGAGEAVPPSTRGTT